MSKQEAFKTFVKAHPELASHVRDKQKTWQEFYEIYDMYGENEEVWRKYQEASRAFQINELAALVKGINMDNVQKYITNAQKAINVIQELSSKSPKPNPPVPKSPRPISKFFGD